MPIFYSSDSDERPRSQIKPFGLQRPLHEVLGGGKVAEVLLWKNKSISAAILAGATLIWFLFEVIEYHFLTLLCHVAITSMLVVYIWSHGARMGVFGNHPSKFKLSEDLFMDAALAFHKKFQQFFPIIYGIACGEDLTLFILIIVFLWILSVIGTYFSFLNLLYLGFLCVHTLPALYQRYEDQVDNVATIANRDLKKFYRKFDSKVLNKIPRGPVKDKKYK